MRSLRERTRHEREYTRQLRLKVIAILGGKCKKCGCSIPAALEINHKKGGGRQERKTNCRRSKEFYLDIIKGRYDRKKLELTCRVCNAWHYLVVLKKIPDKWTIIWSD